MTRVASSAGRINIDSCLHQPMCAVCVCVHKISPEEYNLKGVLVVLIVKHTFTFNPNTKGRYNSKDGTCLFRVCVPVFSLMVH